MSASLDGNKPKPVIGWVGVIGRGPMDRPHLDLESFEGYGGVYKTKKAALSFYQSAVRVKIIPL